MKIFVGIKDPDLGGSVKRIIGEVYPDFCLTDKEGDADVVILNYPELSLETLRFSEDKFYGIFHFGGWKTIYPSYNPRKVEFFNFDSSIWIRFSEFLRKVGVGCQNLIFTCLYKCKEAAH